MRAFGTWSLSAARVVYLVEEGRPVRRFGFAYGTLPDHVETGEERFTVEWHENDDSVWYDILAFSQPQHPLIKLSSPGEDAAEAIPRSQCKEWLRVRSWSVGDST